MGTRRNLAESGWIRPPLRSINAVVAYIEGLQVTQGRFAGEPFRVLPWQRRFLRGALAPGVTRAALSIARANGKSSLVGALAVCYLAGPLMTPRGDVVVVASSFGQSRIVFDGILAHLGGVGAARAAGYRVSDNQNSASISNPATGARIRCIGSDPSRAHGLQIVAALLDEPAQWEAGTSARMLAAITTSAGKLAGFRVIALGTKPADEEHWFSRWLAGGADYAQLHQAPADADPYKRATWRAANPSLPAFPDLAAAIAAEAKYAMADSAELQKFRSLRLNQGVDEVDRGRLLDADTWAECQVAELPPRRGPYSLGIDLGSGAAMSACCAFWPSTGRLEVLAAFPEWPSIRAREARDHVETGLYQRMYQAGELVTCGRRIVDVAQLLSIALERFGNPGAISCDTYRETDLRQALDDARMPRCELTVRRTIMKESAEDIRAFRSACLDGRVKSSRSLLLTWALSGAVTIRDSSGNEKLAKRSEAGRRQGHRDDAAAAAILAVAEGSRRGAARAPVRLRLEPV